MKAHIRGFGQFIGESSRLARLGLYRPSDEQKEFLDEYIDGSWEFDTDTGLVNIEGDFGCVDQNLEDFKGIRFGTVSGDFDFSYNDLTNLIGAPKKVNGDFNCAVNRLTRLEGAPHWVGGRFSCYSNRLTSLEGVPQQVSGDFDCGWNHLTSLKGAPQQVGGYFDCSRNQLTSLKGAPQQVGGYFDCSNNQDLQNLAGLPKLHDVEVPKHLIRRLGAMQKAAAKKIKSEE